MWLSWVVLVSRSSDDDTLTLVRVPELSGRDGSWYYVSRRD